jgi:hypothetical protein
MSVYYRDLNEQEAAQAIPVATRALALDLARKAAGELGLSAPVVVWFTKADPDTRDAYSRPFEMLGESRSLSGDIWLHAGLRDSELLMETIAHEARHIWQFDRGSLHRLASFNSKTDQAVAEADARAWAAAFLARETGRPAMAGALAESPARLLADLQSVQREFAHLLQTSSTIN